MLSWLVALLVVLIGYFISVAIARRAYWKKKNVPGPTQYPAVGPIVEMIWKGQAKFDLGYTQKLGRWFGYFDGPLPVLVTSDLNAVRSILVKDFSHFVNRRELAVNGDLLEKAVSVLKDQRWKDVRSVLVPTFTSGKMRLMNPLIKESCQALVGNLDRIAENREVFEAKTLFGTVTMDVIASTFFGTKVDTQNDPNSDFVQYAKRAFSTSFSLPIFLAFIFPVSIPLLRKLGVQFFPKDVEQFFVNNTEQIIKMRLESKQERKDFLQLMLNSLEGVEQSGKKTVTKTNEDSGADVVADYAAVSHEHVDNNVSHKLTSEELVAQAVTFFVAGYETTATALSFLSYNLAIYPEVQEKLRQEIEDVLGDKEPTYDLVAQMEYLDCCINETLRMYPPLARTERVCNQDWEHNGLKVEKGTVVGIPIYAIHHDPEYWNEPEKFIPERFSKENRDKIKPYSFETFGQGPRNCIGMRFAYFEIKMVVASILQNFKIVPTAKTEIPLQIKDVGFIFAKNGIWITVEKLSS